ncbi:MFS domain-containing protein [Caenorhabditis elegans]|uniref:MFS domain-containing protein n=1 Tax=Caenorhabditis elegans TaxID=6239 RepID=J7SA51_CAEEL|nr:MFS domain-containing protein [Caenorhabditis elegans]CCM09392.1 MFS domain-containing protein [Caenorhabditis elegans]|eukprot:NP_001263942.1 Uncharacterized protein CELE_W04E12.9 [Caenorhabditis elegans]
MTIPKTVLSSKKDASLPLPPTPPSKEPGSSWGLLKDPVFILLSASHYISIIGFCIPLMLFADFTGGFTYILMRVVFLFGMLTAGLYIGSTYLSPLVEGGNIRNLILITLSQMIAGLLTIAIPNIHQPGINFVFYLFLGIVFGQSFTLPHFVTFASEQSQNFLLAIKLSAILVGMPCAAFFYLKFDNFEATYYFGGSLLVFAALISALVPFIVLWREKDSAVKKLAE